MNTRSALQESRSTADIVFDQLFEEIVTLVLLPGTKISEAEIARRFGVSRQPIRDAFRRLGNLDLLKIRPQRATVVRRFSLEEIENTRFLRCAIDLEVIERACARWDAQSAQALAENMAQQQEALQASDTVRFHDLDYDFHKLICDKANLPMAFETIKACKRQVDRLCVLSLSHDETRATILEDHFAIADALERGDVAQARALLRQHLGRLDPVIAGIHETHSDYFQ